MQQDAPQPCHRIALGADGLEQFFQGCRAFCLVQPVFQTLPDLGDIVEFIRVSGAQLVQNEPFQIRHGGNVSCLLCLPECVPGVRRHHAPAVAAVRKKLPDIGGACCAVRSGLAAVVTCAPALDGHGTQGTVHFMDGVEIGDGEGVVGVPQHSGGFCAVELPHHLGKHLRIGIARPEKIVHHVSIVRFADPARLCRLGEQPDIAAFAAERDLLHIAQRRQQRHTAHGEIFRRRQGIRHGQFQHQVYAAFDGESGTGELVQQGCVSTLDEIAAHHGNDSLCASPAHLFQMIQVSVVQGIVFADNTTDFHV